MSAPVRRGIAAIALIAITALTGCTSSLEPVPGMTYRLGPGQDDITLLVVAAPAAELNATVTEQNESSVAVQVEIHETAREDGIQQDLGKEFELALHLAAPLGRRAVVNAGATVPAAPTFVP